MVLVSLPGLKENEIRRNMICREYNTDEIDITITNQLTNCGMAANEDRRSSRGTDGLNLHPHHGMRCELFQGKIPSRTHLFIFREELSQLPGGGCKSPMAMVRLEPATFRLAVECFNHSAM